MGNCISCLSSSEKGGHSYKNFNLTKQLTFKAKNLNSNTTHPETNKEILNGDSNLLSVGIPKIQLTSPGLTNVTLDMNHLEESELILESKYSDLVLPTNITLSNFLISEFKKIGDKVALVDVTRERTFSFPNVLTLSRNVCSAILTFGLKQGEGVALMLDNCPEIVSLFVGIVGAGGTVIFVNPNLPDDEIQDQLAKASPKFIFIPAKFYDKYKIMSNNVTSIEQLFILHGESSHCMSFEKFILEADRNIIAKTKLSVEPKSDIAAIFFTSGAGDGHPKGVMLSHFNILSNLHQIRVMYDLHSNDKILNVIPMCSAYGLVIATLYSLIQGATLYMLETMEPQSFVETIEKEKISHIYLKPDTATFINTNPAMAKCNFTLVKELIFGTEQPSTDLVKELKAKYRTLRDIRLAFSMAEFSPLSHVTPPRYTKFPSFGVILPNTLCKVIDAETKGLLGPNRKGQMCIKGPQVFVGYLNDEAATAKVLAVDGWFFTDDVVYYDKDQYFYYVSRLTEFLQTKQAQSKTDSADETTKF